MQTILRRSFQPLNSGKVVIKMYVKDWEQALYNVMVLENTGLSLIMLYNFYEYTCSFSS